MWNRNACRWAWCSLIGLLLSGFAGSVMAQETVIVRPKVIDDVLVNPGIGFTTFQRFQGDPMRRGGRPGDYPVSTVAYFRIYWNRVEPEQGRYDWDYVDGLLAKARERGQTLMLRISPHDDELGGPIDRDVPKWYRAMVGEDYKRMPVKKWLTDPEDPRYAKHYGDMIRAFGKRYDGHPDLESLDLAIVGAWGEGAGSSRLTEKTMHALVDAYAESFRKTPLVAMLMDEKTNLYINSKCVAGWRADCLGDMGGFSATWSHMEDRYAQASVKWGVADAWKKAPVNFESCWDMRRWHQEGWDLDYIIEQSLKWRISSFNNKSQPVPAEWQPKVNEWLKRMGYRFALRKFSYPSRVKGESNLEFQSWWENKGVAPIYHFFPLALKLEGNGKSEILLTDADIRTWLPGDVVYDRSVWVPKLPAGDYELSIAILDERTNKPRVKLAIDGMREDGWYPMGRIRVEE